MLKYEDLDNNQLIYYIEKMQVKHVEVLFDYVHLLTNYNLFDVNPKNTILSRIFIFVKFTLII